MYILEGNIGVGKSTFLSLVKKNLSDVEVLTEPVTNWNKEEYGQSLLENFYKDTPRWAYTLETLTMLCRVRDHLKEQERNNPNRILERSIFSGHYCFAKNCFESGFLTKIEWGIYNQWVDFLIHKHCKPPLGFIYLKASPEVCYERVQRRNRESEKALSLDYLTQVDARHDEFLVEKTGITATLKNVPVLVLDCNEDFVQNEAEMAKHIEKVKAFLQKTQLIGARTPLTQQAPSHAHQQAG